MTEKRFRLDEEDRLCIHYDGGILASVGFDEIEAMKIVDKLNELSEENRQLKKELKAKDKIIEMYYELNQLNE